MSLVRGMFLVASALSLLAFSPTSSAQSFAATGNLDCNGFSKVQRTIKPLMICSDFRGEYGGRAYDNGHYIGHDEPSIGFYSLAHNSGNNVQWDFTLTRDRPLRRHNPSSYLLHSGLQWRFATQIQVLWPGRASRIVTRTLPPVPGRRSWSCSSILLDSLRSSVATTHVGALRSTSTVSKT